MSIAKWNGLIFAIGCVAVACSAMIFVYRHRIYAVLLVVLSSAIFSANLLLIVFAEPYPPLANFTMMMLGLLLQLVFALLGGQARLERRGFTLRDVMTFRYMRKR